MNEGSRRKNERDRDEKLVRFPQAGPDAADGDTGAPLHANSPRPDRRRCTCRLWNFGRSMKFLATLRATETPGQ
jgi:hypothetical protein